MVLWKRTLASARTVPGVASVIETHFTKTGSEHDSYKFSVVESEIQKRGQIAPYRLTYTSPESMSGVVILNDGRFVWRYSARKRLIARQSAFAAPTPPELEEGTAGNPVQADSIRPEVEPGTERVGGQMTDVLALRLQRSGRMVERRWIDKMSGRTLRFEQYAGRDAHIVRRVEISELRPLRTAKDLAWARSQFSAAFPTDLTLVGSQSSRAQKIVEAEEMALREHLPLHVRGFALRSVERMSEQPELNGVVQSLPSQFAVETSERKVVSRNTNEPDAPCVGSPADCSPSGTSTSSHFYYSKGRQGLSIFVTRSVYVPEGHEGKKRPVSAMTALVPRPGWNLVTLLGSQVAFTQQSRGGAAIAWSGTSGGSYIAIAHMPLSEMLPVIRAFAAERDDAPALSSARRVENNLR